MAADLRKSIHQQLIHFNRQFPQNERVMRHGPFHLDQQRHILGFAMLNEGFHPMNGILALIGGEVLGGAGEGGADFGRVAAGGAQQSRSSGREMAAAAGEKEEGFADDVRLDRGGLAVVAEGVDQSIGGFRRT